MSKERLTKSPEVNNFWDTGKSEEKLREELAELLPETRRFIHEVYDIYPQESPESRELTRIARDGRNGLGLEPSAGPNPSRYYLVSSQEEFAFALGDEVYVSTSVINKVKDEDTIASYPAHEIEHVNQQHLFKKKALEKKVESLKKAMASISLGRIYEYEADSTSPFKLQKGGYDPSAYRDALDIFLSDEDDTGRSRGIDVDHGTLYDRLSIQYWILRSEDFEETSQERTPKPAILENLPEAKNRFEIIREALEHGDQTKANEVVQELSLESLFRFYSHADNLVIWKEQTKEKKQKREKKRSERLSYEEEEESTTPPVNLEKQLTILEFFYNQLEERITTAFPTLTERQQSWAVLSILGQKTQNGLFAFEYADERLRTYGLDSWIPRVSTTARFKETIQSPEDLLEFASYIGNFRHDADRFMKNGKNIHRQLWSTFVEQHGNSLGTVLGWFENTSFYNSDGSKNFTEIASFLEQMRLNLSENDNSLWDIEGILSELVERENSHDLYNFMEELKKQYGDEFEEHTLEIQQKHEADIFPKILQRYILFQQLAEQYDRSTDTFGRKFNSDIYKVRQDLNHALQHYYAFANDDFFEQRNKYYMVLYLEQMLPDEYALYQGFESEAIESAITTYLENHELKELIRVFGACPFLLTDEETGRKVYTLINQYIIDSITNGNVDDEYKFKMLVSDADSLVFDFLNIQITEEESSEYDHVIRYSNGEVYGFSNYELQILYQLDVLDYFCKGLGEELTLKQFREILDDLDLSRISEKSRIMLLGGVTKSLTDLKQRFSHRGDDEDEDEHVDGGTNWSEIYKHPTLLALRDFFGLRFETQAIQPADECEAIQKFSELLGGRGFRKASLMGKNSDHAYILAPLVERVMDKIKTYPFNPESVDDLFLIRSITPYFEDERVNTILRNQLEYQIVQRLNFEESLAFMEMLLDERKLNFAVFDYVQEYPLKTPQQLEAFEAMWQRVRKKLTNEGDESAGVAAVFDAGFENFMSRHAIELFEAALTSGLDDTKLRTFLAKRWFSAFVDPQPLDMDLYSLARERPYRVILVQDGDASHFELTGTNVQQFIPFEEFMDRVYSSLTQSEIDFMLRKMLYTDEGVLITQKGRKILHKLFMEAAVDQGNNPAMTDFLNDVVQVLLSIDTKKRSEMVISDVSLGEPIMGVLRKKLFIKPEKAGSNLVGASRIADEYEGSRLGIGRFARAGMSSAPRTKEQLATYEALENKLNAQRGLPEMTAEQTLDLLSFNPQKDDTQAEINAHLATKIQSAKDQVLSFIDRPEREVLSQPITPIQALILIANSKQTLGERFKQLVGYYMDLSPLSPDERQEIYKSYAKVKGQLKYTAFRTLKREALKVDAKSELRNFWDNLEELESTGHGGSLTTVFKAHLKGGTVKAVKIMVPNARMFIRETKAQTTEFIKRLRAKPKHRNNLQLKIAEALVEDIALWAEEDIDAVNYEEQERQFAKLHQGTTIVNDKSIEITIPEMTPTGSMYIKIEDWAEGEPFIDTIHKDTDLAARVGELIKEHYQQQQQIPVSSGSYQVHPDVHGGQFHIVSDDHGQKTYVYVLDRGFWLEFSEQESTFFNFIKGEEFSSEKAAEFLQYLFKLPENSAFTKPKRMAIIGQITLAGGNAIRLGSSASETAVIMMLELRKAGVKIPLKWSLFQKNNRYLKTLN